MENESLAEILSKPASVLGCRLCRSSVSGVNWPSEPALSIVCPGQSAFVVLF